MLTDGIKFTDTSSVSNMSVEHGPDLPIASQSSIGELFFKDGVGLFSYTGTEWIQLDKKVDALFDTKSFFPGAIAPMTGTVRWYPGRAVTLTSVFMMITTAPSQTLTIDVKKNGTSIHTGAKPSIVSGGNISSMIPLAVSMTASDFLTIDILNGNGSDLAVRIEYKNA